MANDLGGTVRDALGHAARDAFKSVSSAAPTGKNGRGRLSGAKGLAAGAGLAAAVPLAKKGVDAVRGGGLPKPSPARAVSKVASTAGDKVGENLKDAVTSKVDEAGGAGGLVKEAASGLVPGLGGDSGGGKGGMPGVGKGRRMPVQQWVDVAVPLETAYNQWTQFEDWPEFMHRVTRVTQEDDCTVNFATKIWGKTKEFTADIETQRPDERIKWRVSQGITHTGVVTFHELAPRLTRIELSMDVDPGSLIEKAARGMRHVKRAARADLHRFKAFIEIQELETGAWRGVIEDGELVEEHDPSYDEERDYSDVEDLQEESESEDQDEEQDEEEDEDRSQERAPSRSGGRTAAASRLDSSRSPSSEKGSSGSRSSSSRGRSRGSADGSSSSRRRSRGAANGGSSSSGDRKSSGSSTASQSKASSSKSSKSSGSGNGTTSSRSSKSSSGGRRKASSRS